MITKKQILDDFALKCSDYFLHQTNNAAMLGDMLIYLDIQLDQLVESVPNERYNNVQEKYFHEGWKAHCLEIKSWKNEVLGE
jgi:hypothetical protein